MDPRGLIQPCVLLLTSICVCVVSGGPIGTSVIDCVNFPEEHVGSVDEGYEGDVELFTGIEAGTIVELRPYVFPEHLEFLELSFTPGDTTATVRTKKPLDADILSDSDSTLYYSVTCVGEYDADNYRTLKINDLNDHSPVFAKKFYTTTVPEELEENREVFRVTAEDGDSTDANNRLTYSYAPHTDDFELTNSGAFILKRRLNYNEVPVYTFNVTAKDSGGLNDTATVSIKVKDFDNLNPYFSHNVYEASIPENQVGPFVTIKPEAIKAQDGDKGINMTLLYSISAVSPKKYKSHIRINPSTGALSVQPPIDREEMGNDEISVTIQAAQRDDRSKKAEAVVSVTIEDVNDNKPEFDKSNYTVTLLENSPVNAVVFKAIVTDKDQGGFVGDLQIIPESSPFSIDHDGTVRVKNSAALDRETIENITFQIEARESNPPNTVTVAEVSVTLQDENDNSPVFTIDEYLGKVFANQTVGMLLVQVKAEDADAGINGQIEYSIDFGNKDGYFSIEADTGEIKLAKTIPLQENKILEFLLTITARDEGIITRSNLAQVNIRAPGHSNPQFLHKVYHGTIKEGQDPGFMILEVNYLAIMEEFPVTLEVWTETDKFNISSSGEFTNLVKLDYDEAPHSYSVNISISDGTSSDNAVVEIRVTDINDNSPVFNSSFVNISVSEDTKVGSNVTVVAATDKDSSINKEIRYSLRGGEARFYIDPLSGMVSVAAALDRETKAEYNLQVVAEDQGRPANSATASLLVQVTDINDNVPKFSQAVYQVLVSETDSVGTNLLTLSAVDPDEGVNGRVTYSIYQQSPPSDPPVFEMHSDGTLWLAQALSYSDVKVYGLMVQASDGGNPSLVGNGSVVVRVKDMNNNPPEFSKESYEVAVPENLASGVTILTLEVTDKDEGGFVGTLRILPESAPFSISPDGTITVKNSTALDREITDTIMFEVEARETNSSIHVATANVSVTLLDENDNSPKFTSDKYESKVFSNQTEGMLLVKVEAEDPDEGVNGQFKFSIEFGNQDEFFTIDENTGEITLEKMIPVEDHQTLEFLLFITARDGGVASLYASAQVKILAVGDKTPQFIHSTYSGTIEEEADPGTMILKVDFLEHPEIPWTLRVETEADKFNISSSGEFTTKVKLDYDEAPHSYSVNISISDGISSDIAVVEVGVTDINDNSPVFNSSSVNISVSEDTKVGSSVTVVAATDKDSSFNKEIRYSLRGGEGRFAIDPLSGMVSVAAALDRETKREYNLQVVAEDQGRPAKSATASLLVQVTDINDNVPKFSQAVYQVLVSETDSVGTNLLTLSAVDRDEGVNGRVTYSIYQQSPPSDPPVFEMHSDGTLWLAQALSYSEVKVYGLMVQASDGGNPSLVGNGSVVVRVKDMNNHPPEFSKESYEVAVPENLASGVTILTLEVTDKDEGGFVGTLRILPESAPFSISPDGTITVKNSTALDREITDTIMFEVEARETNSSIHVATANVSVTLLDENDNSPKFTSDKYESKVFSNQTEGMLLVKVEAEDPDEGVNGQIKFSIEFGNQDEFFTIDESSGEITLEKMIPVEDHQTLEFLLFITARDGGVAPRSASAQVKILAVGDKTPQFIHSTYSGTIEEEADPGTTILKVDFLATSEIPWTLRVETEADKFNISSSGELTTKVKLDYDEAPHSYSVNISISDGISSDIAVVEVGVTDINDNSPVFNSSSVNISVSEDTKVGSSVTVVAATDKDSSINKEIRYSLRGGEGRFAIDPLSGMVSVAAALDRETKREYNLQVVAEDQGCPAMSATASLLVQVTDINDNVPKFSQAVYQVLVSETDSVGTNLLTLSAVDPDEGVNGRVTYSIYQQSPPSDPPVFEMHSDGTLWLAQALSYSEVKVYGLMVQASDGGNPSLVGNGSVVVRVKDMNNHPPEFSKESYEVAVPENLASGVTILTLEVTDKDEGGFVGTLRILPESAPFSISPDGTITVKNSTALDREITDTIMFEVEARETNSSIHVATANVSVTLLDENDNSPKFTSDKYESKVFSNQTEGMLLVKVEAEDPDEGVNGQIKFSIEFGNQDEFFTIDESSGEITLEKMIPVEDHQTLEFLLFITARDGGVAPRSASAQVKILAVGDKTPQFIHSTYSGTIEEEADPGTTILKVDFLATSEIPWTLRVETEADKFNISSSGELTTKVKLDYDEAPHSYSVNISISDGVSSDIAVVEVGVTDINDNSPVFNSSSVNISVSEDTKVGSSVTVVAATDKDSSFNKEIRYSLRGGEGRFAIDPLSGMVSVAAALDRETKAEYNLQVVAEDQGSPAKSATASLLVQVTDINDNVPKFSQAVYQVLVSETDSVGTNLLTLSAVDLDEGVNGRVTYSIYQQSPPSDPPVFEMHSNGTLWLAQALSYSDVKVYGLMVQASDGGNPSLVGNGSVVVRVKDMNNNPPEFSKESYEVAVPENLASGVTILTLEVTDKDEGGFVGTLRILPESAPFSISPDGTITVKNSTALDREITDTIMFEVEARETNSSIHVATANVSVTLLDENDNSPKFTSDKYESKVFSNQTEGMLLVKVEAEDPDEGVNGQIKFSIEFGNQDEFFTIDESSGEITLEKMIPVEDHQTLEFLLFITARDGGVAPRSASAQVKILAVGDKTPQFIHSTYSGTIEEEADPGTTILKVDFLATSEIPWTLRVETEADKFNISSSGELTTKVKLDYDEAPHSYSVNISISDGISSDIAVVEVGVTDINDNSPVFNSSSVNISVSEDTKVGSSVTVVAATDKDSSFNKEIRYSLRGGEGRFAIDPLSGMVSVAAALDRETKAEYNLQVVAEDQGSPAKSATASLLVQVTDINDNVPKFSQAVYQVLVSETDSVGTNLFTLSAVDRDEGVNGRVTYSIYQQSPPSDPPVFEMHSDGTVWLAQALSYSDVKVYGLMVQASDGGNPSLVGNGSVVVRVKDMNNNPPEFSKESYEVAVPENLASGVTILTLEVTDKDEGGFVGTLRILPESAPFSISPDGTITVKNSTALDREITDTIMFEVEARETNSSIHVATANVSVTLLDENDNSPKFTSDKYESKVFSNQTEGMLLVKVEAEDPDKGVNGQIKFSIEFGNQDEFFTIDENTGEITLEKMIPVEDHQTLEFLLFITARDGGVAPRSASAQVKILAVGDKTPQFIHSTYSGTIEEEADPGTMILKVDFLATSEIPWALRVETEADKFNISSSGEFTNLVKLDYDEAPHSYSVNISISDGISSDIAVVEVGVTDINDNSPVFNSSSVNISVSEDTKVGSSVTVVAATDKDSSFNKEIRYSLRGGEGRFDIDPLSGMVSVAAALDRETKAEYNLQVVAEDQGRPAKSATASLLVQVTDINDNVPKFSQAVYQVLVSETDSVGTNLLTLSAVDPDEGVNGRVTYSIYQQSPPSDPPVFEMHSDGTLWLAQALSYSDVKVYGLMVQASDGGNPSLVGNGSVVVRVKDMNNHPPEFSKESYDVAVPENLASGVTILTLEVTDKDEGGFSDGHFLYTSDTFDISKQGVVSLKNNVTLDRETKDSYVLQVVAVDQASDGLSATAQLNITVLDYNDNAPHFPAIPYPIQFAEGDYSEKNPGEVFTIVPTDPDLGPNGEVTVSLLSPHPLFRFREDGTLLAVGSLDRESRDTYDLVVKASDKGSPQRERVTAIRVSLMDVNDNKPEFTSSIYFSSVLLGDAAEGKPLLTLVAIDKDVGKNSRISYSFSAGSSPYLALNTETGVVTLTSNLADVTEDTTLQLTAMATDHGQPPLNSTAHVVIKLLKLRVFSAVEGAVVFSSSHYHFNVTENAPVGRMAGMVSAYTGSDLYNVTYKLKTHADLFSINDFGAIQTRKQLDKEKQEWYTLDVEAVDTRTPPTSAVAMVLVQVKDVNEPPQFPSEVYRASVFSIAPYKTPVIQVKASDPDVGDESQLVYSLSAGSPYFDVEPSSGLVYVVSAVDLAGQQATVEVKATDPRGLDATTKVEVTVKGSASRDEVAVISLNRPANTVEKNVPELEKALGAALKWTVNVIEVSNANGGASESRTLRAPVKTLVSFIALEGEEAGAVSSEEVTKKLKTKSDHVTAALVEVLGEGLHFETVTEPQPPTSDKGLIITLSVGWALSIVGLIVAIIIIIITTRLKRTVNGNGLDKHRHVEGYTNWSQDILETELGQTRAQQQTDGPKVTI